MLRADKATGVSFEICELCCFRCFSCTARVSRRRSKGVRGSEEPLQCRHWPYTLVVLVVLGVLVVNPKPLSWWAQCGLRPC